MAISYHRGMSIVSLKQQYPDLKGAMMAVGGGEEDIAPLIAQLEAKEVRIACFNSPSSLTISGDESAIDELQVLIEAQQMFNRKLQVDVAYHSHHMKLVADEYEEALEAINQPASTKVRFHSSLHGHLVEGSKLQTSYWVDNLTKAVRFSDALTSMCKPADGNKTGVDMIVEIGPHSALAGPVKQILKACGPNAMSIPYSSALVRKKDAVESAMDLAAALFVKGAPLNLGAVNFPSPRKALSLLSDMPRYPWNHQTKYWHESRLVSKLRNRATPRNDILGTIANYSNDLEPTWRNILRVDDVPWLRHHKIQGLILFPMSGFLSMAIEAAAQRAAMRNQNFDNFVLRDVSVIAPLMLTDQDIETTLQLRPVQDGNIISTNAWDEFRIHTYVDGKGWTEHCKGLIAVRKDGSNLSGKAGSDEMCIAATLSKITEIRSSATTHVDNTKMYASLSDLGVAYGPTFQGIADCQTSNTCSSANITVIDTAQEMPQGGESSNIVHPAFLEQLIEMYWPIFGAKHTAMNTIYLPSSIGHMTLSKSITELTSVPGKTLRAFCKGAAPLSHARPVQTSMFAAAAESDEIIIQIDDLTIAPIVDREVTAEDAVHRQLCYKLEWEPVPGDTEDLTGNAPATNGDTVACTNGDTNGHVPAGKTNNIQEDILIIHGDSEAQKRMASSLCDAVEKLTGKKPELAGLGEIKAEGRICLFIAEFEKPLLSTLTALEFLSLQTLLTTVQGVLWVVRGAYVGSDNPDANMVTGLSRSIRSETLLKFVTLDLDSKSTLSEELTMKAITDILKSTFDSTAEANCEMEFMEREGSLFTPRIVNDEEMNEYVHKQTSSSTLEPTPFVQTERALKLAIGIVSDNQTVSFFKGKLTKLLLAWCFRHAAFRRRSKHRSFPLR